MKKKLVIAAILLLLGITFTGCSKENIGDHLYTVVDKDTGVNYVVYSSGYTCGVSVRYNADGSIYVSEVK